jgi:putative transposase
MSDASFYKWRAKYGGMDVSNMTRLKGLDEENCQLKKMYAESQVDCEILREAMTKKF